MLDLILPEYLGTSSADPGPTPRIGRLSSRPLSKDWLFSIGLPCGPDSRLQLIWSDVSHSCRKACSSVCSRRQGQPRSDKNIQYCENISINIGIDQNLIFFSRHLSVCHSLLHCAASLQRLEGLQPADDHSS